MPEPRVATGLYVNWDSIVTVDSHLVSWLRKAPKTKPRGELLTTIEEACFTLSRALKEGGREHLITQQVHDELNRLFPNRVWKLGGNGYHMGKALYDRGFAPLVSYPYRPPRIMQASPNFAVAHKGRICAPSEVARDGDCEYDHVVFEFRENPTLGVARTGRHILSWDEMSSNGHFDLDFLDMASTVDNVDILILGYAHLLLPAQKHRSDAIVDHLNHSKRPRVHFEVGEGSRESVEYALNAMTQAQCVDSLGVNERECVQYLGARSEDLREQEAAATKAVDELKLKRICIHTPRWVVSVARGPAPREAEALTAAAQAAARMTTGGEATTQQLERVRPAVDVERLGDITVTRLKTLHNPKPRVLTGLGDVFAAIQAAIALA